MEELFPAELNETFRVQKHVGGGSYGEIYRVTKRCNNKVYAMKAVTRNNSSSWKDIEIEMQVLSFVNPYKLHLDCFFVDGNTWFMIVDYCPNGDLLKAVVDKEQEHELFKEDEIWKYFIQICFGLESLHYNEFIHRDLHLQNILLDENNNVKLADFGISRYLGTNRIQGAEAIRSPRTLSGNTQTKESDIWAVGYVLYYLCTLKDPFNGNPNKIQREPHRPISNEYSKQLRYFVDWCLKKERIERPTIIDILTHEFIVDKTRSLRIEIPQTSIMNRVSLQAELSAHVEIESLNLKLESQSTEIERLKAERVSLKNIIAAKSNDIETFRLKAVETAKLLESRKSSNEKELAEVKKSIRALIAGAEKTKKILDYSEQDLNVKEPEIAQIEIITAQNLINKRYNLLWEFNNSAERENEFRRTCSAYQNPSTTHDASCTQVYQDYLTTYHQQTSLFNVNAEDDRTTLLIYNTETETQESKVLQTPLDRGTCIIQIPDGKLFCFGSSSSSSSSRESPGITLLIDVINNYSVEELPPSGTRCWSSSCIYFKNNVYCFGGHEYYNLNLSSRFDLNRKKWNELTPLPKEDQHCNSIIFNGSILISGWINKNLWRYSIASNSFTTIPYDFAENKRKILINAERLYLIECNEGSMHESEIGSDATWRRITGSTIDFHPWQAYFIYNKGGIYIGCMNVSTFYCFKFNLNEKRLIKLI